ncbi:hypothetical protein ACH5RR_031884 [Cinchona calisaya]|uniref:Retrotransposon gag domain-containing protein n=1 Tax=Cinchona calisaya TaxID=153742 RepID=A0ABD2YGI9_9GENT
MLRELAQKWFKELPPNSIDSFMDIACKFTRHFMSKQVIWKEPAHLMNIQQKPNKTLKQYIDRFSNEVILVRGANQAIMIIAFMSGIKLRNFNTELATKVLRTFNEFLRRVDSHIHEKESNQTKRELYNLKSNGKSPLEPGLDKHGDHGHNIEECNDLKFGIEQAIEDGFLQKYIFMVVDQFKQNGNGVRSINRPLRSYYPNHQNHERGLPADNNGVLGVINIIGMGGMFEAISGRETSRDTTNAQKL